MQDRYVGLDIGGTKLIAASADADGRIIARTTKPTPLSLEQGLETLDDMIREVLQGTAPITIAAAIGGPVDQDKGTVSPLHQPEWRDVPLRGIMEAKWGCSFYFDVDTRLAAYGEYFQGAEDSPLLYITISTGVGGALLIDGQIYTGTAHPEVGHIFVRAGVPCACGADGCLEALVSGSGIRRLYGKPPEDLDDTDWQQVAHDLGTGLRNLATTYAPAAIVLGGGIAIAQSDRLLAPATEIMRKGLRLVPHPDVRISALGNDTALMGTIALAVQDA